MNILRTLVLVGMSASAVLRLSAAEQISAQQLRTLLDQPGPHPILIDVRKTSEFVQGSIPGAINIPARVLLAKKMNFSRGCIIISDGLVDKVDPAKLADDFSATGVSGVRYLHGGLAAWSEMVDAPTTTGTGATIGRTNSTITYQDLAKRDGGVCLVDLRPADERGVPDGHKCPINGFCRTQRFDYVPTLKAFHRSHAQRSRRDRAGEGPLVVLVGGKETDMQHEVKKLHVQGFRRVAVLLGGGEIIATEGRRGRKRGTGAVIEANARKFVPAPSRTPKGSSEEP